MVGIVIVTHGDLGKALIDTSTVIFGKTPEGAVNVSINLKENVEKLRKKINDSIKSVDDSDGILILTDMFGGTPSNLSYSFLEEGRIEVISGVNLPVLFKALELREKKLNLNKMAKMIEKYGKKSITLASEILKGNKKG